MLDRLQGQVHEVVDVMRDNIGKVMDRGDRLEDLQDKSGGLFHSHLQCKQQLLVDGTPQNIEQPHTKLGSTII